MSLSSTHRTCPALREERAVKSSSGSMQLLLCGRLLLHIIHKVQRAPFTVCRRLTVFRFRGQAEYAGNRLGCVLSVERISQDFEYASLFQTLLLRWLEHKLWTWQLSLQNCWNAVFKEGWGLGLLVTTSLLFRVPKAASISQNRESGLAVWWGEYHKGLVISAL